MGRSIEHMICKQNNDIPNPDFTTILLSWISYGHDSTTYDITVSYYQSAYVALVCIPIIISFQFSPGIEDETRRHIIIIIITIVYYPRLSFGDEIWHSQPPLPALHWLSIEYPTSVARRRAAISPLQMMNIRRV